MQRLPFGLEIEKYKLKNGLALGDILKRSRMKSNDGLMTVQLFCQSNETTDLRLYLKPPA